MACKRHSVAQRNKLEQIAQRNKQIFAEREKGATYVELHEQFKLEIASLHAIIYGINPKYAYLFLKERPVAVRNAKIVAARKAGATYAELIQTFKMSLGGIKTMMQKIDPELAKLRPEERTYISFKDAMKIYGLRKKGWLYPRLEKRFGMSRSKLRYAVGKFDVELAKFKSEERKNYDPQAQKIFELRQAGWTYEQLQKKFNRDRNELRSLIRRKSPELSKLRAGDVNNRLMQKEKKEERAAEIIALRKQKWTYSKIGEKFEITRERIRQILLKHEPSLAQRLPGVIRVTTIEKENRKQRLKQLIADGLSDKQIMAKTKWFQQTIYSLVKELLAEDPEFVEINKSRVAKGKIKRAAACSKRFKQLWKNNKYRKSVMESRWSSQHYEKARSQMNALWANKTWKAKQLQQRGGDTLSQLETRRCKVRQYGIKHPYATVNEVAEATGSISKRVRSDKTFLRKTDPEFAAIYKGQYGIAQDRRIELQKRIFVKPYKTLSQIAKDMNVIVGLLRQDVQMLNDDKEFARKFMLRKADDNLIDNRTL